jgi:hypothetical protein
VLPIGSASLGDEEHTARVGGFVNKPTTSRTVVHELGIRGQIERTPGEHLKAETGP